MPLVRGSKKSRKRGKTPAERRTDRLIAALRDAKGVPADFKVYAVGDRR